MLEPKTLFINNIIHAKYCALKSYTRYLCEPQTYSYSSPRDWEDPNACAHRGTSLVDYSVVVRHRSKSILLFLKSSRGRRTFFDDMPPSCDVPQKTLMRVCSLQASLPVLGAATPLSEISQKYSTPLIQSTGQELSTVRSQS